MFRQGDQASVSSIRRFWRGLNSTVHPDDNAVLQAHPNIFNLDFPLPAFIGDVDNAPVIILMGKGGFDATNTPQEFPQLSDQHDYIQWLKGERADVPRNLSPYYTQNKLFPMVRGGKVVFVNAVAYRSEKITNEVQWLAKKMPSAVAHQKWLREELLPAASNGTRLVIAHRYSLWQFPGRESVGLRNVFHCSPSESRRRHLPKLMHERIKSWLGR